MRRFALMGVVFLGFLAGSADAETLILRSGAVITGQIISQNREAVRVRTATGILVLSKAQVLRISYDTPEAEKAAQQDEKRHAEEQRAAEEERVAEEKRAAEEKRIAAEKPAAQPKNVPEADPRTMIGERNAAPGTFVSAAVLRSMVFPGWGERYQGRARASWTYGGLYVGALVLVAATTHEYNARRSVYQESLGTMFRSSPLFLFRSGLGVPPPSVSDDVILAGFMVNSQNVVAARQSLGRAANRAIGSRVLLLGVIAASAVDVILFRPSENTALGVLPSQNELQVRMTIVY